MMNEKLIDVHAVAERLSISWRTVLRRADDGSMPPGIKIGAARRWRESELEEWVAGGCRRVRPYQTMEQRKRACEDV